MNMLLVYFGVLEDKPSEIECDDAESFEAIFLGVGVEGMFCTAIVVASNDIRAKGDDVESRFERKGVFDGMGE